MLGGGYERNCEEGQRLSRRDGVVSEDSALVAVVGVSSRAEGRGLAGKGQNRQPHLGVPRPSMGPTACGVEAYVRVAISVSPAAFREE